MQVHWINFDVFRHYHKRRLVDFIYVLAERCFIGSRSRNQTDQETRMRIREGGLAGEELKSKGLEREGMKGLA